MRKYVLRIRYAVQIVLTLMLVVMFVGIAYAAEESIILSWALGGTGGANYINSTPIAEYINANSGGKLRIIPTTSGGSAENVRNMLSKTSQIAICFPYDIADAWNTGGREFRYLGPAMKVEYILIVTLKGSGINSVKDLAGRNMALGARGSAARLWAEDLLTQLNILDKINDVPLGSEEVTDAIKDGDIEAYVVLAGNATPVARIQEVAVTHPINILDLSKEVEESKFIETYPWYEYGTIPSGLYNGMDKEIRTIGSVGANYVRSDVPDWAVLEFMKHAYSKESQIANTTFIYEPSNLGMVVVPFHPAAHKFWEDRGLTIPKPLYE